MSAEKEIVNYWYNKSGFFTINNIKTGNNRDCGILALKFVNGEVNDIFHVEVSCSITNNIAEAGNPGKAISRIVDEKFENRDILKTISSNLSQFPVQKKGIKKIIILGAVQKSRKNEIISEFSKKSVEVIEFEDILMQNDNPIGCKELEKHIKSLLKRYLTKQCLQISHLEVFVGSIIRDLFQK